MNSYAQAQRAYAPTQAHIRTERSTEYEVIARISYRLKRAIQNDDFVALAEAIHENNKLWMALALDVAKDEKVLRKVDTAVPLLEINAAILKGLKQEVPST